MLTNNTSKTQGKFSGGQNSAIPALSAAIIVISTIFIIAIAFYHLDEIALYISRVLINIVIGIVALLNRPLSPLLAIAALLNAALWY